MSKLVSAAGFQLKGTGQREQVRRDQDRGRSRLRRGGLPGLPIGP
jgi:hypothetical protein